MIKRAYQRYLVVLCVLFHISTAQAMVMMSGGSANHDKMIFSHCAQLEIDSASLELDSLEQEKDHVSCMKHCMTYLTFLYDADLSDQPPADNILATEHLLYSFLPTIPSPPPKY